MHLVSLPIYTQQYDARITQHQITELIFPYIITAAVIVDGHFLKEMKCVVSDFRSRFEWRLSSCGILRGVELHSVADFFRHPVGSIFNDDAVQRQFSLDYFDPFKMGLKAVPKRR